MGHDQVVESILWIPETLTHSILSKDGGSISKDGQLNFIKGIINLKKNNFTNGKKN